MTDKTETIWNEFNGQLRRFILNRVVDESIAEDILQEVFVKVHTRVGSLRDKRRLRNWVYQIARNSIIDHYRDQKGIAALREVICNLEGSAGAEAGAELAHCVQILVDALPDSYRGALLLTQYCGFTQRKMGESLGISLSGAKSRVRRARKELKRMLLECCHHQLQRAGIAVDHGAGCDCCSSRCYYPGS